MLVFGFSESIDRLAVSNSVYWCGQVLWWWYGHIFRGALEFEVKCEKINGIKINALGNEDEVFLS